MRTPVKIAIAESSVIIRSGLISVLKRLNTLHLIEVVELTEVSQLKKHLVSHQADLLIISPTLPGLSLQQLKKEVTHKQMKYVALQNTLADNLLFSEYDQVISVYDNADTIKDKISELIKKKSETEEKVELLSSREKEILICVIKGFTNKQIADMLFLSTHTVSTHRRNISAKLQIHSTSGLIIYAIVNKLIELSDIKHTFDVQ